MPKQGDTIAVTWGAQTFSPVPFNSFTVGPFSITTTIGDNETAKQTYDRAKAYLDKLASVEYVAQRNHYYAKIEQNRGNK